MTRSFIVSGVALACAALVTVTVSAQRGGGGGLPVAYILNTLNDFKNGVRKPGDPRKVNVNQMITSAKNLTPEEARSAAEYFSSTPWTQWVKVVETKMVPKTDAEGSIFF